MAARRPVACTAPEDWSRCRCGALSGIDQHVTALVAAARIVERDLAAPAPWNGRTRRESLGYGTGDEAARYQRTFDWAIRFTEPVTEDLIGEIHERAVGGRHYRECHLWTSTGFRHPEPPEIGRLMGVALQNHTQRCDSWPSPARALGLHLDLLTAHPFRDGNGRTARLAAAVVLAQAGFRATVFTAVDGHFELAPHRYLEILDAYRFARICRSRTIELLVRTMRARAARAPIGFASP